MVIMVVVLILLVELHPQVIVVVTPHNKNSNIVEEGFTYTILTAELWSVQSGTV